MFSEPQQQEQQHGVVANKTITIFSDIDPLSSLERDRYIVELYEVIELGNLVDGMSRK